MSLRLGIGMLVAAAMLAPLMAFGQDMPVPLPRRMDRMPVGTEQLASPPTVDVDDAVQADVVAEPEGDPTEAEREENLAALRAATQAMAASLTPQLVTLKAKITENGDALPDGVTWRVFETKMDTAGDLILAEKSDDATAHLQLPPGEYVVHVAFGRAQTTETITVGDGPSDEELVLDAGAMRLGAAVTGDVPIPINLLHFDIYTSGNESNRTLVAQNLGPADIVTLNAGTYHVVSYFGEVNAVVRADLRVEPGQLTEATLYHKAAQVSLKLVSETGGEAIADIDWTIKTADGQTVFSSIGAFPSTVLAEGDYLVFAKRGDQVYNRQFQVQAGPPREIEVLTTVY